MQVKAALPHTARRFARAIIMPNLKPPVRSLVDAAAYPRISHKEFLKSHNLYPVKARQDKGFNSLLFFVRPF